MTVLYYAHRNQHWVPLIPAAREIIMGPGREGVFLVVVRSYFRNVNTVHLVRSCRGLLTRPAAVGLARR
jgi:hypothetical protein